MIKMYVMHTCPDCEYVEKQVVWNPNFEVIDIGKHVRNLKQFIKLRDTNPAFDEAKAVDDLGIPCYVLEDGTVTLYSKDVGLEPRPQFKSKPNYHRTISLAYAHHLSHRSCRGLLLHVHDCYLLSHLVAEGLYGRVAGY